METVAPRRPEIKQLGRWQLYRQTLSNALIVTRREVVDSFRDWRIIVPILVLTLGFPALGQFGATLMFDLVTQFGAELIGERTIPYMLMIVGFFPISLSLVIALETFVGEKERRSLEPLLSAPLTNLELYIGKTLAAMLPPLVASYIGMTVYLVGLLFGELAWRPQAMLIVQIILLTTAQALLMVTSAVVISSQTTSTRAANLLASFIIVPIALLVILESFVMFGAPDAESPNGIFALWMVLVGLLIGTALFMRIGTRLFNREGLLNTSLDALNLRWIGRTFWGHLRGQRAGGLISWYRREVLSILPELGRPAIFVAIALGAALIGGWIAGQSPDMRVPDGLVVSQQELSSNLRLVFEAGGTPLSVLLAVWQNGRVLFIATMLATISFGVLAVVLVMAPFGILGWIFAQFTVLQLGPELFVASVLPHSMVEIPAIILATAAALRLGATITARVPEGKSIGELWLKAFADTVKIGLGMVLPLLVISALIEVYVTPLLVQLALGG